ncbi:SPRY domain-containing SOCS box protein 3 [Procambarus clarkii]|uniref:SPRY domain-containing SOCS box protein 3 n=1 Tax=Procambarus clarkii TaxID=6728 RepID=UPI001E676057|nr:uncharacterized protein LOC123759357 isoform X1 [Procambarus clarkii]XP_045600257.1 uncharacterized protein LOC123759357 isoform X1 [Procambarus clarkii]
MEEILAWKWDPSPSYDYLNFIRIDSFQEILAFALRSDQHSMVVVKGNEPLAHNLYHCWTIFIQNIWNAEVMVGVATESADFTDNWNQRCRIGKDEHSWALSSGGSLCHNNIAIVHEDYRFFPGDFVTVYLDLIQATLMFALNNKIIGLQYNNLPHNIKLYPVVGVARRCELRLVSAHVSQPSLHLMSLVSHIIARCKARSPQLKSKMIKMPEGSSFMWHGAVSIDKSQLPPGLKKDCIMRYPWFSTDHRIKPLTRIQSQQRRRRNKHQMPKVIRLADPFEVPKLVTPQNKSSKRAIRSRKCQCGNSDKDRSCSHEKVLRFFRKRDICYLSSSDDEIFPEIAKRKKQHR